ncbi:MAG: hypothetical protein JKX99_01590 [Robiginitomaculum sp.]|nr:hypothetical protein [Robiginitomaculum sp.]
MNWYIKVRDMVYGPYTIERMTSFAAEGRVGPQSEISDNPDHSFKPAGEDPALQAIFNPVRTQEEPVATPKPTPVASAATFQQFVLYTELAPATRQPFIANLRQLGTWIEPIPGVWVIKSPATSDQLRNVLSRALDAQDSLLVFEIHQDRSAWFNIGETADREIRKFLATN